ncbi:hypothetical protein MHYP_G00065350 [Metynnis hypsauchen]
MNSPRVISISGQAFDRSCPSGKYDRCLHASSALMDYSGLSLNYSAQGALAGCHTSTIAALSGTRHDCSMSQLQRGRSLHAKIQLPQI